MQHPLEPAVSIIRKLTDPGYAGCRIWDDLLAALPNVEGWFTAYQADQKMPSEVVHFLAKLATTRSRLLPSIRKCHSDAQRVNLKKALGAAVMTTASTLVAYPFLTSYCTAATLHARFPKSMLPFRGNIGTWRQLVAHGSILSLWRGCIPMVCANLLSDLTARLRLGTLATLLSTLGQYCLEVVSIRMMCWDSRHSAGWTNIGPMQNIVTGYVFKLIVECTGAGYYLPLSSTRLWLLTHNYEGLSDVLLGTKPIARFLGWIFPGAGTALGFTVGLLRGVACSMWAAVPMLLLQYATLDLVSLALSKLGLADQIKGPGVFGRLAQRAQQLWPEVNAVLDLAPAGGQLKMMAKLLEAQLSPGSGGQGLQGGDASSMEMMMQAMMMQAMKENAGAAGVGGGGVAASSGPPAGFEQGWIDKAGKNGPNGGLFGSDDKAAGAISPSLPTPTKPVIVRPVSDTSWEATLEFMDDVIAVLYVEEVGASLVEDEFVELASEFTGKARFAVVEKNSCPTSTGDLRGFPYFKVLHDGAVLDEACLQATAMGADDLRVLIEDACDKVAEEA